MDQELKDVLNLMIKKIDKLDSKIDSVESNLNNKIDQVENKLDKKIDQVETKIMFYVENNVTKKIESLFDGYKLTHEKQWELERRVDKLEQLILDVKNSIAS